MSEVFAGLKADDYDRVYSNRKLVGRIWRYLATGRWTIVAAAGLIVGSAVLMSSVPIVISRLIDTIAAPRAGDRAGLLSVYVVSAAVIAWGMNWCRQVLTAQLVGDVVYRLQQDAADAALAKDLAFYDRNPIGSVLSRVTGDTEGFSSVMTLTLNFLSQLFLVLLLGGLVFWIDVGLGLIVLAMAPLLLASALAFRKIARQAAQRTRRVMARVNANVHESMGGIAVAKSFGQERAVYADFDDVNRLSYVVYLRQGLIYAVIMPVLALLSGLGTVLILYAGGRFVLLGDLSTGAWYFGLHALGMLWLPLTQAASFWSLFQQGLAASERVFGLMDRQDAVVQVGNEQAAGPGAIELVDVDFGYSPQERVFCGLRLRIDAGQTVAVVGHTGAGKSSLAKIITRAYEYQGGQVLIDGRDLRHLDLVTYRRRLAVVPQHPFVFSGTLGENIAYARAGAARADVEEAIERLGKDIWERSIKLSLDDTVATGGRGMSLGQRQLIALARVFVQRATIVLLDEPTASVDPLTERGISEALARLLDGRTVIVIAHRLSTIRQADRIVVLDGGRVVEDGTFEELVAAGGHFTDLHETYYAHQCPEPR